MKRIAITGMGTLNPIGNSVKDYLKALKNDVIGIERIKSFDAEGIPVKIAGEIKDFNPKDYMERRKARKFDRFLQIGLAATKEALEDSDLLNTQDWKKTAACTLSSGIGGAHTEYKEFNAFFNDGPRYVSPFLIPMIITNMMAGVVSMEYKLQGPNYAAVSACAGAIHSIITGALLINSGKCDVAIVGGVESAVSPPSIAGFANMMALSKKNDDPKAASNPFDKTRDGFVLSEGSGVLILESEEHAKKREAKIYAYLLGGGMSADAHDFSASDPEGEGPGLAMSRAVEDAGIDIKTIDLINGHATGTPVGDRSEGKAILRLFGEENPGVMVQGTKTLLGHTISGSGAIELIGAILQSRNKFVHGMPNLNEPEDDIRMLNFTRENKPSDFTTIMKNSFGFGGQNASVIVKVVQ